ncbi:ParM/StbA family protein [Ralstonia pseudosolanacearum]|uniref:ParM/StbA family protein n=1 Tax=Ralstonia pseudosolanacearum TaxID=1310165 RepID=UPI003CF453E5
MLNQTIIGLDVGRSAVKATAFARGMFYPLTFPSIVTPAIDLTDESTARRAEAETIEVAGKRFFTGDTARLQGSAGTTVGLSHDWINTPEYLALVGSTMKRFAAQEVPGLQDPLLVIGTPASLYGSQQEQLKSETQKIVQAEMRVLPQPMGAYCDFFLDQSGLPLKQHSLDSAGRKKSWAVIEVGHFTTDFLLMLEGQYIERGASSCEGLNFAAEHLLRILSGKGIHANLIECEQALRTKSILQFGQDMDIAEDVAEAVSHVAQKIIAKADSLLSTDVRKLNGVLLAGGGAPLIYTELKKKWPHCILLENPRMAVANGFCRYGMGIVLKRNIKNPPKEVVHG